jgi:2-dehydropantoate 2-reductase
MRIAVIGPGAVGGTVAAWLAQAHDVQLCARTPLTALHVETPDGPIAARPSVVTDPTDATPADWVIVATKTYDAEATARWFPALLGADTRVAVFQNGVEHVARFAPWIDAARIVPAIVDIPAERIAPGRMLQRRNGSILLPARGAELVPLFAHTPIAVSVAPDFTTAAWLKLCLNCAGAVNALIQKPAGIATDDGVATVKRTLVAECVAVGRAEGAVLDDDLPELVVRGYRAADPDSINSLHADRLAGRPMEIDARNGVIVRLGAHHGIQTPTNATIVALLQAV